MWRKLLESESIRSSNICTKYRLNISNVQAVVGAYSFDVGEFGLGSFAIVDMLFPFLAFFLL